MKAFIIVISLTIFQISSLFGETFGDPVSVTASEEAFCVECAFLTPNVPLQASYEDQKEVKSLMEEDFLSPEIPLEADFADSGTEINSDSLDLAPQVPMQATFQETL